MEIKGNGRECPKGGPTKNHENHQNKQKLQNPSKTTKSDGNQGEW